jgi:hypothetical protein
LEITNLKTNTGRDILVKNTKGDDRERCEGDIIERNEPVIVCRLG